MSNRITVGIDTGGTFTDFVVVRDGNVRVHKVPSTPHNPAVAVLSGIKDLLGDQTCSVIHGSTVATNAILERKGARTALVTTAGFEDVLEIGRQIRPRIYDLNVRKAPPLVDSHNRIGVRERVGADGDVVTKLDGDAVAEAVRRILKSGVESVAICFLHAYTNTQHEQMLTTALEKQFDGFVSSSHAVLAEFREYERCATTVVNAYVGPIMKRYLTQLGEEIGEDHLRVMQSNGGVVSSAIATTFPVQTVLSGPAGGVVGGFEIGRMAGFDNVITFDMGGTSTDVCLCSGEIGRTVESSIGEIPVRVPVIDIHTVGAGGGSIAMRDPGGSLKVGPDSAGAMPGPICYGRGGTDVTVTDANLFLGRLSAEHFLGGQATLDVEPVNKAMSELARQFDMAPSQLAHGIVRVANATMERAIRVISLERGYDPRDFTLVCFGGAGGMHAADLIRTLGLPRVLVPKGAGALSALGMLMADFVRDYSRTVLIPTIAFANYGVDELFGDLERRAEQEYSAEGVNDESVVIMRSFDMRYVGQGYELSIPLSPDVEQDFHDAHERRYGYADPDRPSEIVNVRVRAVGRTTKPELPSYEDGGLDAGDAIVGHHTMIFGEEPHNAPIYSHDLLRTNNTFAGPGLIVEYSTTTTVPPDFSCTVDRYHNLVLERI